MIKRLLKAERTATVKAGNGCEGLKKYIGLEDMSNVNCSSVLRVIQDCGGLSRRQITDITGLSWGGMTKIVNKLFDHGYLVEEKSGASAGNGRIPGIIRINGEQHFVVGLDMNKTGLSACVTDLSGDIKKEYAAPNHFEDRKGLLGNVFHFLDMLIEDFGKDAVQAVGVAVQGEVDAEKGISVQFPGCADWRDVPMAALIRERYGMETYLEHDPDCMLLSELEHGDGDNQILFRMDQSVGMAVSLQGNILRGRGLLEVAHSIVVPGGKLCRCGLSGCLEAYVAPCIRKDGPDREAVQEMLQPLALTIHNMAGVFHADRVILTGDLIKYHEEFEEQLLSELRKLGEKEAENIIFADGTGLAVRGAALFAAEKVIEGIKV